MRRLGIEHVTEYRFVEPTRLLEHRLWLRPRENHGVRIASSSLEIEPPATIRWQRDILDNSVAIATFRTPATRLRIASTVVIEHYDETPLDFVVDERAVTHPFRYDPHEADLLAPFLAPSWPDDEAAVRAWLGGVRGDEAPVETFALLDRLNRAIHDGFRYQVRELPGVQSPTETLKRGEGSCRDFAALFVDACRHAGLASRFVSGYLHDPTSTTTAATGSTHAWAEVFLPGPGWKGFDPTVGEIAGADHIAVAVARRAELVPPVAGSFLAAPGGAPQLFVSVRVRLQQ